MIFPGIKSGSELVRLAEASVCNNFLFKYRNTNGLSSHSHKVKQGKGFLHLTSVFTNIGGHWFLEISVINGKSSNIPVKLYVWGAGKTVWISLG